jgi:hypothetical protein
VGVLDFFRHHIYIFLRHINWIIVFVTKKAKIKMLEWLLYGGTITKEEFYRGVWAIGAGYKPVDWIFGVAVPENDKDS